jgi:DNA repair protein RadC
MIRLLRDICTHYVHDRLGDQAAAVPAAATAAGPPVALHDDAARPRLATSQALLDFLRVTLAGQERERLLAVFLDPAWRVITHRVLQEGGHDQVAVYPRQIVEHAVRTGAAGIVLAHNHPSGQASPSAEDIRVTHAVAHAAALLDIHLVDHVIVAGRTWYSFADHDLIPQ